MEGKEKKSKENLISELVHASFRGKEIRVPFFFSPRDALSRWVRLVKAEMCKEGGRWVRFRYLTGYISARTEMIRLQEGISRAAHPSPIDERNNQTDAFSAFITQRSKASCNERRYSYTATTQPESKCQPHS
ncbi:hypothetical protein L249_4281 [Ophiocordyceps polyrhachis-furcata BCC 54312]|uniref:Uncharacterized protein n=1 Tax=Ophiocordyceps polyrhachis-furcata BCC 54312 TaxID=1330021 RepID=A0A367L8H7_9HYPO|nr:hypothetical protein L249_4281 [Ophiocordyceps polyrhachis-furcata BCC 54312]